VKPDRQCFTGAYYRALTKTRLQVGVRGRSDGFVSARLVRIGRDLHEVSIAAERV
jgi:hypothetical protein